MLRLNRRLQTESTAPNPAQTIKAISEAEAYHGPSLIIGYSPCEMHSIKGGMMNCQKEMKKAVECGYWNLFRASTRAAPAGQFALTDSKAPAGGYQEFLMNEAGSSRLTRQFRACDTLFARNEEAAKERYEHLVKLIDMLNRVSKVTIQEGCRRAALLLAKGRDSLHFWRFVLKNLSLHHL